MREPDRIKQRIRDAKNLDELRAVWISEQDAIHALSDLMKRQVRDLKDIRKKWMQEDAEN